MNTNGLIAPAGVKPLPINTNGHLCILLGFGDAAVGEHNRQRILDDDKIIFEIMKSFMEQICH